MQNTNKNNMQPLYFPEVKMILNPPQGSNISMLASINPKHALSYQMMMMMMTMKAKRLQMMMMEMQKYSQLSHNPSFSVPINTYKQETLSSLKEEIMPMKLESPSIYSDHTLNHEDKLSQIPTLPLTSETHISQSDQYLKMELDRIVTFLLSNMGKANQTAIDKTRKFYLHNQPLLQVYDKLVMKYFSAKKCREDIVRYVLRKIFKVLRTSIIQKENVTNKKATIILCKKYFQKSFERIQESGVNVENEDQLIDFFMPYKKKSQNRTMNTNFVVEIFSSEDFCREYESFLGEFENLLEADNNKKKEKLLSFLMECVKQNSLSKIRSFNRLPWLDIWIEDTRSVAFGLMPDKKLISDYKKVKQSN